MIFFTHPKSPLAFLTKLIKQYGELRAPVSDKNPAIICAVKILRKTDYRKVKDFKPCRRLQLPLKELKSSTHYTKKVKEK